MPVSQGEVSQSGGILGLRAQKWATEVIFKGRDENTESVHGELLA